jgi:hypothetical protein
MPQMRRTREGIGGMTMGKEKKIAEIQKSAEEARKTDRSWVDGQDYADDVEFLLDELEQTRKESNMLREELHKFQELAIKAANHHKAERNKLIEVLRWYADKTNYVQEVHHLRHGTLIGPAEAIYYDEGQRARDILKEIGVMDV